MYSLYTQYIFDISVSLETWRPKRILPVHVYGIKVCFANIIDKIPELYSRKKLIIIVLYIKKIPEKTNCPKQSPNHAFYFTRVLCVLYKRAFLINIYTLYMYNEKRVRCTQAFAKLYLMTVNSFAATFSWLCG